MTKTKVLLVLFWLSIGCNPSDKIEKDYTLSNDKIKVISKQIDSMYNLDQNLRHTFDTIDFKYKLTDGVSTYMFVGNDKLQKKLGDQYFNYKKETDSLSKLMRRTDSLNTLKLIDLTKKYGFPNNKRLGEYKSKAYLLFVHSPRYFFPIIDTLVEKEYEAGRISEYKRKFIRWHLDGRNGFPPTAKSEKSAAQK